MTAGSVKIVETESGHDRQRGRNMPYKPHSVVRASVKKAET
jgi:hypothetical protein